MLKIATYGTLKRGYNAHRSYMQSATFLGEARTSSKFHIVDFGPFPGMFVDAEQKFVPFGNGVLTEIYEITPELKRRLDNYEGGGYTFEKIEVEGYEDVYAYLVDFSLIVRRNGERANKMIIESGIWQ